MTAKTIARLRSDAAQSADITDLFDFAAARPHRAEPEGPEAEHARRRYRTVWISDVHLGTRGCNADLLIDFLDHVDSDTMYLVGDMIDGWWLKKRFISRHTTSLCAAGQ